MHIYAHSEDILMYNHVASSICIQGQGREQEGVGGGLEGEDASRTYR